MADSYYTFEGENGNINVSDNVVAVIASAAVSEVDGFAGFSASAGPEIASLVSKKTVSKGVRVQFDEEAVTIDICISVKYGKTLSDIAKSAQAAACAAVEEMIGIRPTVNVHITGVSLDK